MKWILIFVLTLATIVIQLFLFWVIDEKHILNANTKHLLLELNEVDKVALLDKKVKKIMFNSHLEVSNKVFSREKLLMFFDQYRHLFNLSVRDYFNDDDGMIYLTLSANLVGLKALKSFLDILNTAALIEIQSITKHDRVIQVDFRIFYPFKEYL